MARGAYISTMHVIEDGMTHIHSAMFANQKQGQQKPKEGPSDRRLVCKFLGLEIAGRLREHHTDPATGICYTWKVGKRGQLPDKLMNFARV